MKPLQAVIERQKNVLAKCKKSRTDDVVQELQSLIEIAAWETDVTALLLEARSEGQTRFAHKLAPGFRDAAKTENCYGDYIIWKVILAQARDRNLDVTLLTNDAKDDWVYRPKYLRNSGERNRQPNNGSSEPKVWLAQPYLDAEFAKVVGEVEDRRFYVADTVMLAHLLGSNTFNPQLHGQFQNLLRAASTIAEDTPTHAVIGWFLNHPDEYSSAIHGVCKWEHCPSEVSEKALADFVVSKLPDVDAARVGWGQVITELFL